MPFPHQPMTLTRRAQPFSHPDWLFEIKHDGFRALAYLQAGQCQLVSRNGYVYKRFGELTEHIGASVNVHSAVLDGEIVCLDKSGKSQFKSLMYRRGEPYFYAFDILQLNGKDLRSMPLHGRKQKLKSLIPGQPFALLYVDHVEEHGERLFHLACREDLEGIVAKLRNGTYDCQHATSWIKIKNPAYTQIVGRQELFEKKKAAGNSIKAYSPVQLLESRVRCCNR
jgi:bifunctional non-homologous end joining protein LigD